MNDVCIVTINGDDWIIPCDRVNDIGINDSGGLVGLTSSSLTLYQSFSSTTTNPYPRITCQFGRYCYFQSANQQYDYLTSATLEIKSRSITDDLYSTFFIGVIAFGVLLWNFFRH